MTEYYPFKIVRFPDDDSEKYSVDILPSEWIFSCVERKCKMCHFPCGPFSARDISKLHEMVKKCQPADQSWPVHRVIIIGRAKTYSEAQKAAKKCEYEPYAFSTDRESSVERKIEEENTTLAIEDGKKKDIDDEFDEAVFDLLSARDHVGRPKRQSQKNLPKVQSETRRYSLSSEGSTTENLTGQETDDDDDSRSEDLKAAEKNRKYVEVGHSFRKSSATEQVPIQVMRSKSAYLLKSPSPQLNSSDIPIGQKRKSTIHKDELLSAQLAKKLRTFPAVPEPKSPFAAQQGGKTTSLPQDVEVAFSASRNQDSSMNRRRSRSADRSNIDIGKKTARRSRSSQDAGRDGSKEDPDRSLTEEQPGSLTEAVDLLKYLKQMHNSLSSRIDRLYGCQLETNGHIQELEHVITHKSHRQEIDVDEENLDDENFALPVKSKAEFYVFDEKLKDKGYIRKVAQRVKRMVDKYEIKTHNLSSIMRIFLSKNVIVNDFTALKKTATKDVFQETTLYQLLKVIHQTVQGTKLDDKAFNNALKSVFNSAKDWEGGRLARLQKE
ncbi:uncharacterized protein [Fopius arisanus]|uniref:Uncharacterized protein n=1 Tax=Fopius arisanus TaxID=64838 RepID=A0A9R1T306_9HYME|nr:PREDICTED: uncharacterized protein LOC105265779 [Fopius arisanus]XP_011301792.1 PREDICTED: uncharacterized protein LOC105265779 [Fopius arisanus]